MFGVRTSLEHDGFEGWGEVAISFILDMGWRRMLKTKLPAVIAQSGTPGLRAAERPLG